MKKQKGYVVMTAKDPSNLRDQVEAAMKAGWECSGGVCVVDKAPNNYGYVDLTYHQAMVMYADYGD